MRIHYKTFKYSVILLIALIIPFNAIHEIGHLIPCWYNGGTGSFIIGLSASQAVCKGALQDSLVFTFAGGALALIFAIIPLAVRQIQRSYTIIALGSLGIGHFIVAIVETWATNWYMTSDQAMPIMTFMSFIVFVGMLIAFGREEKLRKDKYLTFKEAKKILEKEKFG